LKPERRTVKARRIWLAVHRWLGLALGAILALMGLTGSVIVFDHAIDGWLNPHLFTPRASGQPRGVEEVIAAARAALPGAWRVSVTMPGVDHDVFELYLSRDGKAIELMVDPASAEVLGQRPAHTNLTSVIYHLHSTLLVEDAFGIRDVGTYMVAVAGLGLLVSTLTGLYLWPRWGRIGQTLSVKWGATATPSSGWTSGAGSRCMFGTGARCPGARRCSTGSFPCTAERSSACPAG
jgi:uncharacterized iron-regulated membrane protein